MDYCLKTRIKKTLKYIKLTKKVGFEKEFLIKNSVLGRGYQGTVYKYCYKDSCLTGFIAIKKIYLNNKESKYIKDPLNKKALGYGNYIELASSILINQLLLQNISQNFIFNYSHEYSERDGICSDKYPYVSYHFNEYIGNSETYSDWVQYHHQTNEWYNAYFQIMSGIYALQKYFNMTHLDLHAANILIKKIEKGGYWNYIIDGNSYIVPNLGYIFYIGDFGQAYIHNLKTVNKKVNNSSDIHMLFKSTLNISLSSNEFKKNIKRLIKKLKLGELVSDVIYEFWGSKYQYSDNKTIIETFNMDKKLKIKDVHIKLQQFIVN